MKKKLRAQIKALANQIAEKENTFNSSSIKKMVSELYEKLVVLEYLESQIDGENPIENNDALDSKTFREENWFKEPEPVPQPNHQENLIEPLMEKIKDIVAQMPEESGRIDEMLEEILPQKKTTKNDIEEFASRYQQTPTFERKEDTKFPESIQVQEPNATLSESRAKSINDKVNKGLNIGLNDRLAFIKHLFEGNSEDFTRVLSQVNTLKSYDEAQNFIKGKVKPDYNFWLNKEVYEDRFMNIIEKSFN